MIEASQPKEAAPPHGETLAPQIARSLVIDLDGATAVRSPESTDGRTLNLPKGLLDLHLVLPEGRKAERVIVSLHDSTGDQVTFSMGSTFSVGVLQVRLDTRSADKAVRLRIASPERAPLDFSVKVR